MDDTQPHQNIDVHFTAERSRAALSDALRLIAAKSGDAGPHSTIYGRELSRLQEHVLGADTVADAAERLGHLLDALAAYAWACGLAVEELLSIDRRRFMDQIESELRARHYTDNTP